MSVSSAACGHYPETSGSMEKTIQEMPVPATIVVYREEQPLDRKVAALADFYGVRCSTVIVGGATERIAAGSLAACVMLAARSLRAILRDDANAVGTFAQWLRNASTVLVYGIADPDELSGVRSLTD